MGAALTKLGKNFVQISQDNAFGQGSAAGFYKVVKADGGTFPVNDTEKGVGTVFAPPDTTDFTPYINQILDSKADVLIVTWSGSGLRAHVPADDADGRFQADGRRHRHGRQPDAGQGLRGRGQLGRRSRLPLLAVRYARRTST